MSEICPHCRLNTAGQHESHCPLGRALNLAMSIQVEPDDRPFPESQPIRPSVEMDRIAALEREVENLKHQITCDVCAGTGKSTDGALCACGGSGLIGDLLTHLRRENAELRAKLERAEAARDAAVRDRDDAIHRGQNYQEEWHEAELACRNANELIAKLESVLAGATDDNGRLMMQLDARDAEIKLLHQTLADVDRNTRRAGLDMRGACDCTDNDGVSYQSRWLADIISRARATPITEGVTPKEQS